LLLFFLHFETSRLYGYALLLVVLMACMYVLSIIEMMEEYTNELEDRLRKTNHGDRKLVPDDIALNVEPVNSEPSCTLDNFTDSRLAVMMMRVDSATAESRNDCSFVEMVRKVAMSVVGEVIFMEEGRNSMIVAVAPNTSRSTGTPVTQLLMITGRVIKEVCAKLKLRNRCGGDFLFSPLPSPCSLPPSPLSLSFLYPFTFPFPLSFLPLPFYSLIPFPSTLLKNPAKGLGSDESSPSGSGRIPLAKRFLVHFEATILPRA